MKKDPFSFWEWFLVLILSGCLVTVSLISWLNSSFFMPKIQRVQKIAVTIQGAVKNPGIFVVLPNSELKKILHKAKPLKMADLSKLDLQSRLEKSQTIDVPFRKKITIHVTGALENPDSFELPIGSSFVDLLPKLKLYANANVRFCRKNRILKHQEEIIIPQF